MTKQSSPTHGSPRPFGSRDDALLNPGHTPHRAATRIIALGSAPLMDGFRLAGVEVMPNAGADELESLLKSLVTNKEKALVLIESGLADEPGPWLERVRSEGGRIVVVQVPSLAGAGEFHSDVDRLIGLSGGMA